MKLKDFFSSPISANDFIQQTNIIRCCDYIFHSDFFCEENKDHFGIENLNNCITDAPDKSCIIMCRFKDDEISKLIESCSSKRQYKYVIVQTIVGDDGFIDESDLKKIPENVIAIYSKNIKFQSPKLKAIPIGRDWRNTAENNTSNYIRSNFTDFQNIVYLNFSIETCEPVRGKVHRLFSNESWVTIRLPYKFKHYQISHTEFVKEIHNHKFCFSPVGIALDCYRTWDSLFAKTIPIVDRNFQVDNYKSLPILFTDNWEEISKSYLEEKYLEMLETDYDMSLAFTSYWFGLFNSIRETHF